MTAKKHISSMANSIADCAKMRLICLRFVNYHHRPNYQYYEFRSKQEYTS